MASSAQNRSYSHLLIACWVQVCLHHSRDSTMFM
nr:MAG TPA: hypothetical protein [Caudoviricetes sp.]